MFLHLLLKLKMKLTIASIFCCFLVVCGLQTTFKLERAFPVNHTVDLSRLSFRDGLRQSLVGGATVFTLNGSYDPQFYGFYFTTIKLGSPPKEYNVLVDTGSDVTWVGCNPCANCPRYSDLQVPIQFYDPSSSSTASKIFCADEKCALGRDYSDKMCSVSKDNICGYQLDYEDKSGTIGYYVSDLIHLNRSSNASIVFGCSTSETGHFAYPARALDGLVGLGRGEISLISQLNSQGLIPKAFSHCLSGRGNGGGILALGHAVDPNMVYTSFSKEKLFYKVELLSIVVNGIILSIDPAIFGGAYIDSGTSLAYLPNEAYEPFVTSIKQSFPQSVEPFESNGHLCYPSTTRQEMFPEISLQFAGGASMVLRPKDYLLQQTTEVGKQWCVGFSKTSDLHKNADFTLLGDLVMKDKIVVYDLGGRRIGWADHNCTLPFNVSTSACGTRYKYENPRQIGFYVVISIAVVAFIIA